MRKYRVITYRQDDDIEIDIEIEARDDASANNQAARLSAGTEWENDWYVLNEHGQNING